MLRALPFTLLFAASLSVASGRAPRVAEGQWRRVDTPNFVVIGTQSEKHLAGIGRRFEGFREALTRILSPTATSTAVPTIVIAFPNDKSWERFRPLYHGKRIDLGGLFVPRADVNYVLLGPENSPESWRTVFHEYSHLIISNIVPNIPPWLNEGLAEYYSSFELSSDGRHVKLGLPIASHYGTLSSGSWLTIPELVGTTHDSPQYNEGVRRSTFYAESWLLVHMLLHGEPDRSQLVGQYADAVMAGASPQEAWTKVFGNDDLMTPLRRYGERHILPGRLYTLSEQIDKASGVPVPLSQAQADSTFAELLLALNDRDAASDQFAQAVRDEPTFARAVAGMAKAKGTSVPDLPASGAGDWLDDYMLAAALMQGPTRDTTHQSVARAALERVVQSHPFPNAYAMLADASGSTGAEVVAGLTRAHEAVPARDDYGLKLALALASVQRFADARALAGQIIAHPHLPGARDQALSTMRWIVQLEQRAAAATHAAAAPPASMPAASDRDTTADSGNLSSDEGIIPEYRQLQPGEQRTAGALERMDCAANTPAVASVRTDEGTVRFTADSLNAVEFLTYRSDVGGSIRCGPRVPPDAVYITWKGDHVLVAVEFLPVKK